MSYEKRNLSDIDVTEFERMSIDELEEILRQEAAFSEMNESSINDVIHIMGLIADRRSKGEHSIYPDVEEAKKSFDLNYRPIAEAGELLFDYEDDFEPEEKIQSGKHHKLFRTAIAIAAVIALLVAGSAVASAMGFNVWKHIAEWTHETFGYSENYNGTDTLVGFEGMLNQSGIDTSILPTYIPNGYEIITVDKFTNPSYDKYQCHLSNGADDIIIEYVLHAEVSNRQYEKDVNTPSVRTYNGVDYYFINNDNKNYVAWTYDNIDGVISFTDSGLDIERIVKSIPGE